MLNIDCENDEMINELPSPNVQNSKQQLNLNRPFACSQCELCFERASQLDYHQRNTHLCEKSQTCQICGKQFFRKTDLTTHLNIHLGTNQSVCNVCGRKFNHVSNLIRHSRIHAGMKPYPCSICGKRFTQISSVVRHKRLHETEVNTESEKRETSSTRKLIKRRHYCKICGDTFPFIVLLRQHERKHFGADKSFNCDMCKMKFETQSLLQHHKCKMSASHTDLGQQLYDLEIDYLSHENLGESRTTEAAESAEVCLVTKDLMDHLDLPGFDLNTSLNSPTNSIPNDSQKFPEDTPLDQLKHSDLLRTAEEIIGFNTENQSPGVRLVQHEEGDQFFELVREPSTYLQHDKPPQKPEINDSISSLVENSQDLANESPPKEIQKSEKPKKSKDKTKHKNKQRNSDKYECTICNKKFSTASNLKQHRGTHFQDQQKFHCKVCDMSFAWKSTLNKHMASNHRPDGPQKFVCEICPKVYSTLAQVNEHVKRDHLKVRDHVCQECGKTFFKKFDLKSHMRTHTKERPYVCRICDKTFYHQSHIIRHERMHSGERPYSCSVCQKTFDRLSSLKAHRQRNHEVHVDILEYQNEDDPMALSSF